MNFITRFSKFFIGFLIGSVLVYILLIKDRDRNLKGWLPGERVTQEIQDQDIIYSNRALCQLKCLNLSDEDLSKLIETSKVNFSESQVRKEPCPIYQLESGLNDKNAILEIQKCPNSATLLDIKFNELNCECS